MLHSGILMPANPKIKREIDEDYLKYIRSQTQAIDLLSLGGIMKRLTRESIQPIVDRKSKEMQCNCDLDNMEPSK